MLVFVGILFINLKVASNELSQVSLFHTTLRLNNKWSTLNVSVETF